MPALYEGMEILSEAAALFPKTGKAFGKKRLRFRPTVLRVGQKCLSGRRARGIVLRRGEEGDWTE